MNNKVQEPLKNNDEADQVESPTITPDFVLDIEINAEGSKLAYLSRDGAGCGFRIAGPKAWGGSRNIAKLKFSEDDLICFIKGYAPEIISKFNV